MASGNSSIVAVRVACGRVRRNEAQRIFEQGFPGFGAMPGGSSRRVRKRNKILTVSVKLQCPALAHDLGQRLKPEKLGNGELPDRQDELRAKEIELVAEPMRAFTDFLGAGDAITAARVFARKAPADSREVDAAAGRLLIPSESGLEPAKERLARRPGKWSTEHRFLDSRRLADQEDATIDRATDNHGFLHLGASPATRQRLQVSAQRAHDQPKSTETIR